MPDAASGQRARSLPDPSTAHLLTPKWLTARARAVARERGHGMRLSVPRTARVGILGVDLFLLYRLLRYFRGVVEIGPLLAGQASGPDPGRLLFDSAVVERHHRALEFLSGARSRSARIRPGGLAQAVSGQAARNDGALELDGGADGGADVRGIRRRVFRGAVVSADRARHVPALSRAPRRDWKRRHAAAW